MERDELDFYGYGTEDGDYEDYDNSRDNIPEWTKKPLCGFFLLQNIEKYIKTWYAIFKLNQRRKICLTLLIKKINKNYIQIKN